MRSRTMNMSQGKPLKLLTLFAVPLLIGNLFQQAYNLADSIIVGQFVGAGALAAVGAWFHFIPVFLGVQRHQQRWRHRHCTVFRRE